MSKRPITRTIAGAGLMLAALTTAGCAAPSSGETPDAEAKPAASNEAAPVQVAQVSYANFGQWRAAFRRRAAAAGVTGATYDRAFAGIGVNDRVLELDRRQPEFSRPIWEYLDSAASETRVANGREKAVEQAATLAALEQTYGVEKEIIVAIWGLESAYGFNMGSIPVIESLATLAYDGRRRDFAEEQLIEALKIIQSGDVSPSAMVGSWAGAMGHTQFIPTSYQAYAQDFTGDGRRDVWAADPADALASTANYLARFGWTFGQPWGVEARLPDGFDYALADQSIRRPVSFWRNLNVTTVDGLPLPDHGEGAILLPAGAQGPAFVVFKNFRVIKRYNNATSYAMAVGHLGDRIRGAGPFVSNWPRGDRPLSRTEKREMQALLTRLGFDTQGVDGIIGPNSIRAVRGFQRSRGLIPDGYASARFLDALRAASGG